MNRIKIQAYQVQPGMYVAELDRPWLDTPFHFQGFRITSGAQVRELREHCDYVWIDTDKGIGLRRRPVDDAPPPPRGIKPAPLPPRQVVYEKETEVEEEFGAANEIHAELKLAVGNFMDGVKAGDKIGIGTISTVVSRMRDSMLRNPNAFLYLSRLKSKDAYSYSHCIQCSAFGIAFGRELGLPPEQIHDLAMGALMLDVGKLKLPDRLLLRAGPLTDEEMSVVRMHVGFSLAVLENIPRMSPRSVDMVATHHERFDGSGYPSGLAGGEIPLFGRMAGIIDFFVAVTNERPYAPSLSPHAAIIRLYDFRNNQFQSELLERFIKTVGAYPVGTLVELSNGEVGIVIAQNDVRRLQPRVIIILDRKKKPIGLSPVRDLMVEAADEAGNELTITRALPAGSFGIDPTEFYL